MPLYQDSKGPNYPTCQMRANIRLNMHSAQTQWLLSCSQRTLHPPAGLISWRRMLLRQIADFLSHRALRQVPLFQLGLGLASTTKPRTIQTWKLLSSKPTAACFLASGLPSLSVV